MEKYNDNTLIVNLIGGPCCGKSTISAELFSRLKKMGIKCELCVEYIKERIYEENKTMPVNQLVIFGHEHYTLKNKLGKVDVIIHDGSLINNILYNNEENEPLENLIVSEYNRFNNLDFFIDRGTLPFENYGRIHDLKQSLDIDSKIQDLYIKHNIPYTSVESRDAVDKIIPIIFKQLQTNNFKNI